MKTLSHGVGAKHQHKYDNYETAGAKHEHNFDKG